MNAKSFETFRRGFWSVAWLFAAIAAISVATTLDKAGDARSWLLYGMGLVMLGLRELFRTLKPSP